MKYNTEEYSKLLDGRLPTSNLEFELADMVIDLKKLSINVAEGQFLVRLLKDHQTKVKRTLNQHEFYNQLKDKLYKSIII